MGAVVSLAGVYVGIRIGCVGVWACGRMGVCVFLVETLCFFMLLFFLLFRFSVYKVLKVYLYN